MDSSLGDNLCVLRTRLKRVSTRCDLMRGVKERLRFPAFAFRFPWRVSFSCSSLSERERERENKGLSRPEERGAFQSAGW